MHYSICCGLSKGWKARSTPVKYSQRPRNSREAPAACKLFGSHPQVCTLDDKFGLLRTSFLVLFSCSFMFHVVFSICSPRQQYFDLFHGSLESLNPHEIP